MASLTTGLTVSRPGARRSSTRGRLAAALALVTMVASTGCIDGATADCSPGAGNACSPTFDAGDASIDALLSKFNDTGTPDVGVDTGVDANGFDANNLDANAVDAGDATVHDAGHDAHHKKDAKSTADATGADAGDDASGVDGGAIDAPVDAPVDG